MRVAVCLWSLILLTTQAFALTFPANTHYRICFTPQQNCTKMLVNAIDRADKSIYVQAYSFTSRAIAGALVKAQQRGVKVYIILDKSNFQANVHSSATYLLWHRMPIWNDKVLNIAHNKVMIFDQKSVELGSFNYTWSAQKYNAENMLMIDDPTLAQAFLKNWCARQQASQPMNRAAKTAHP